MRFQNVFESLRLVPPFHDKTVHHLTHEVLTGNGLALLKDGTGKPYYEGSKHIDHVNRELEGIGWVKAHEDHGINTLYHPNHMLELKSRSCGYTLEGHRSLVYLANNRPHGVFDTDG